MVRRILSGHAVTVRVIWRILVTIVVLAAALATDGGSLDQGAVQVARTPPDFSETYAYADGLEVMIADISVESRAGVPIVEFAVTVGNRSAHTFTTYLQGELRYGPYRRLAMRYLIPPGPDDSGSVQAIAIGATADPYRMRFVLPRNRDDLVLIVSIDDGRHDPAVFAGAL